MHRTLEGLAARDQPHAARAFVDDGRGDGTCQVARALGLATAVDQAGAAHVTVGHLVTAQVNRVVAGQFGVDALVELAVAGTGDVQRFGVVGLGPGVGPSCDESGRPAGGDL